MDLEHPRPFVPNRDMREGAPYMHWACEQPENDELWHVLWHAQCEKCMIALKAAILNDKLTTQTDLILMAHGATFVVTDTERRQREAILGEI